MVWRNTSAGRKFNFRAAHCIQNYFWLCHSAFIAFIHYLANLQELRVSFERLADIIDTTQESDINDSQNPPLPAISGDIKFEM